MQKHEPKTCPFGDDIVSYMYDEMPNAGQLEFERHLAACEVCTDDFAAVSLARFETYDWKRVEFDPLATPQIVIPYPQQTVTFGERIWAWTSWVTVVPVLATIMMATTVGLIFWTNSREPDISQEQVDPVNVAPPLNKPAAVSVVPKAEVASNSGETDRIPRLEHVVRRVVTKNRPSGPKSQFARRLYPNVRLGNDMAINVTSDIKHAPRLGVRDDEEDDKSLRLADLFDETNPPPQR